MEILTGSDEFLGVNVRSGWATILVLLFLLLWQFLRKFLAKPSRSIIPSTSSIISFNESYEARIVNTISDDDLRDLVKNVEGKLEEDIWEDIVEKRNNSISYKAWSCKAKDGPLKYLSVTTFENCSTELLKDFYMDNEYRKIWDKTLIEFEQLQIDETSGIEIGRMTKKFPFLTPREYVLAWRLWEGKNKTFYCITKDCEHARAPRQKKYVRVNFYKSGWRIKKVQGRDACEIKILYQEDAGLNIEMAKMAFARGIWSYVCKMDNALRKYSVESLKPLMEPRTTLELVQKVPLELESGDSTSSEESLAISDGEENGTTQETKLKKSSKKWIANGLLLVGGAIYLSRGHPALTAKLALACILKKLAKYRTKTVQTS